VPASAHSEDRGIHVEEVRMFVQQFFEAGLRSALDSGGWIAIVMKLAAVLGRERFSTICR
jgi:hypothetical protein